MLHNRTYQNSLHRFLTVWPLFFAALLVCSIAWLIGPGIKQFRSAQAAFFATRLVAPGGSDAGDCTGAPCATINYAIGQAASGDTISVAAGTYNGPQILINKSVNVIGAGAATTIIDGLAAAPPTGGLVRIETPLGDTGNVSFSGFTVTNPGTGGGTKVAIFAKPLDPATTATISNTKILGVNSSDNGIYSYRSRGTVVFDHNEITNVAFNGVLIEEPQNSTDVHHNTISVTGTSSSYFNMTYESIDVTTLQRVADNTINGPNATAITFNTAPTFVSGPARFGKYTNVQITNNVITQLAAARSGISLLNDTTDLTGVLGGIENPVITGNNITGTDAATSNGIRFRGLVTNASIISNNLRDVERGFFGEVAGAGHSATGTQAHYNNIVSNVNGVVWNGTATLNAENNWWGCNYGPGATGTGCAGTANGLGGTGSANIDADPWLALKITAAPNTIGLGGMSNLTADLTLNSANLDTSGSGNIPNGTPVSFAGVSGTVLPTNTTTTTGKASSVFTATVAAAGSASTTVDAQTVSTPISISQAPTITCPGNIVKSNDPNQCGADVTFAVTAGGIPTPTTVCNPVSGSFFPRGTTTVTCTASNGIQPNATCNFTVTINDTQPPIIACPANVFVGTSGNAATVTYSAPAVSDNCPGLSAAVCSPASGTSFAVGVTTVTCNLADSSNNTATCSFSVTVNRVSNSISDPLTCIGPGNTVTATLTISNNGNVNQNVVDTTTFTNLVGVPGTCTISPNVGTCTVTNAGISYTGTLTPGQTVAITYLTQVSDLAVSGSQVCTNNSVTFNGGPALAVSACGTVTCPTPGPGGIFPAASEASDQAAGSVLIYNIYTSGATSGNTQNTRINITNIHPQLAAYVHLFFVAEGCSVADSYLCLTGNQTASFLASDLDPGVSGYLVAVAVDGLRGCPTDFNYLIGDEYVKFATGHAANLGAEGISALAGGLPACDGNSVTAQLNFDGFSYDRVSHVLALDNVGAKADGNDTLLILNRIGGNLGTGAGSLSSVFGIFYDDAENALSFTFSGGHQFRSSLSNNFPRITPRFETYIPAGRTGWFKLWPTTATLWGMTGAAINFNPNAASSSGAFNQGHNLHKLTLTNTANYIIPIFPPSC